MTFFTILLDKLSKWFLITASLVVFFAFIAPLFDASLPLTVTGH